MCNADHWLVDLRSGFVHNANLVYGMIQDYLGWLHPSLYQDTVIPTSGCWLFNLACSVRTSDVCYVLPLWSAAGVSVWRDKAVPGSGSVEQTGVESGCCLAWDPPLFMYCGKGSILLPQHQGQGGRWVQMCGHGLNHLEQLQRCASHRELTMRTIWSMLLESSPVVFISPLKGHKFKVAKCLPGHYSCPWRGTQGFLMC